MSALVTREQWVEARQKEFSERTGAVYAFWPELKRAFRDLAAEEPAKSHVTIAENDDDPQLFVVRAGLFDLKLAADAMGETVFYAFTSSALKKVMPSDSAIYHYGQMRLTRGYWGIVDGPGDDVHTVFADDPQTVEQFPLADRFAEWCVEQLLGGYPKIAALDEAAAAAEEAKEEAAKKAAKKNNRGDDPALTIAEKIPEERSRR